MSTKVMITGVAGLIGSHLLEELLRLGHEVHGLDTVDLDKSFNLAAVKDNPLFHYYKGDIKSERDLQRFFQDDAEVIYHLASVVGVNRYMEDPLSLIDVGVFGTRALIELCRKYSTRMLFASTSEVYGKNNTLPWSEADDRLLGPTSVDRWSYSTSKALCEHMLFGVHHSDNWPMSIVRFFNVYGPRQNPIYVVSKSVHRVLNGLSPELYDGGGQTRCFTYIDDVISGLILAATSKSAVGEVVNLGRPVENTMRDVIHAVLVAADSAVEIKHIQTHDRYGDLYEDIPRRIPDVEKAFRLFGWKAETSLEEGISKTVKWARENPWYLS